MSMNDKVALVTGASRGIGAAIAEQLGKAGAIVIGTATSESGATIGLPARMLTGDFTVWTPSLQVSEP